MDNIEDLVVELGYKVGRLLATYFGMPLGAHNKSMIVLDGVGKVRKILVI